MAAQPNKIAYVTGASRGIGNALVHVLSNLGYGVVGMARTPFTKPINAQFKPLDLSDLDAVQAFEFDREASDVLLINNAGIIGEIAPVGEVSNASLHQVAAVNIVAPQILTNAFLKAYLPVANTGHVLNISSGAAKNSIDAWAAYCASKAALDMFTQTIHLEFELRNRKNWHIHAVAPGVVDTAMQSEIRQADPTHFLALDRFLALKAENELSNPLDVAKKLAQIIENPSNFPTPIVSVRNF